MIAVLDIRGEQRYGVVLSLHADADSARKALDAVIERQLGGRLRDAIPHLMWTVGVVDEDAVVGDRVRWAEVAS